MVAQISKEMRELCEEIMALITDYLLPSTPDNKAEDRVYWLKIRVIFFILKLTRARVCVCVCFCLCVCFCV